MDYGGGAATAPCRGLLPAAVLGLALAGCGTDGGRAVGDPAGPAPEAAPAPGGSGPAAGPMPARTGGPAVGDATPVTNSATLLLGGTGSAAGTGPARTGGPAVAGAPAPATDPATIPARGSTTVETPPLGGATTGAALDEASDAPELPDDIVYHVVKGARFFDILVARIGNREHVVIGETDDMCLDLPDQRDFDGDGRRDALVFRSPRCRGDTAPGLLFFVSADTTFSLSNPFPGHRPRVERWNGEWSVLAGESRHVLRDGRAVLVYGVGPGGPRERESGRSLR